MSSGIQYISNKMIRYIQEHQASLETVHSEPSLAARPGPSRPPRSISRVEMPEDQVNNSSNALRKLKHMNDRRQMLKGRLSFLQIHEEKNENRALNNSQQYQFHQFMHQELERTRQAKAQYLRQVLRKVEESHQKATRHRKQHQRNLSDAQQAVRNANQSDFQRTKQHSVRIEKSIADMKSSDIRRNRHRKEGVQQFERQQRENVTEYLEKKHEEIRKREGEEAGKVSRLQQERVSQLQELGRLQSMMVERQARSKMSSEQSAMRLRRLIGGKALSTSHTSKLPSVSANRSQTDVVLP